MIWRPFKRIREQAAYIEDQRDDIELFRDKLSRLAQQYHIVLRANQNMEGELAVALRTKREAEQALASLASRQGYARQRDETVEAFVQRMHGMFV